MRITYNARKCTIWQTTKDYTEKKMAKLERFFGGNCDVHVVYTLERENVCKVEITAEYGGLKFRAQTETGDFKSGVDECIDMLIRQIRKHKTKLEKRLRIDDTAFSDFGLEDVAEDKDEISRRKTLALLPMTEDEALLQMNMLGHDFFLFRNEDGAVCMTYKRKDGDYGVIVTQ